MKCPVCEVDLSMSERQGVEIDYCPKCRGVWLDRGELDKIIERSQEMNQAEKPHEEDRDAEGHKRKGKRRGGFLSEMFDFGD